MITTRTPLRISFFGGGTDYPVWYREHGGAVLATTIDKSCYITCRWLPPFFAHHSRICYTRVENVQDNADIEHPSARACLQFMDIDEGVEIHHVADLPARAGLGTSSAFTVGLLLCLHRLKGQTRDKPGLASDAIFVEQELIKEAVGSQDQVSAAYGGFNRVDFDASGAIRVNQLAVPQSRLAELEQHLVLFFTGFSRTAPEIAKEQIRLTPHREKELRTIQELVDEGEAILTNPNRPLLEFGRLLNDSWQLKRALTTKVTSPTIDKIYERGLRAGAAGGKLVGAGGGGFMLFFIEPERREELRQELQKLLAVPFRFSSGGSEVVVFEPEEVYGRELSHERSRVYGRHA